MTDNPLIEVIEKSAEASKRIKEVEKENARFKRLLAEKELAIDIPNEVANGKSGAPRGGRIAVERIGASERFTCKVLGQDRSAFRKEKPDIDLEEIRLRAEVRAIIARQRTWGCWRKARWPLCAHRR